MNISKTVKVIAISDIHLENGADGKRIAVLTSINRKIAEVRKQGFHPVVVCAGDVANGTNGYKGFLEQIETDVVYVGGNHEFWGGDFYEINASLIKEAPKNVHYLYNDFVEIEDTIFAGSSMWTDVGFNTNPDVSKYCTHYMRDVSKITANKWYKNDNNIKKLKELYLNREDQLDAALLINSWNILIEREENKKTTDFFNILSACVIEISNNTIKEYDDVVRNSLVYSHFNNLKTDKNLTVIKYLWNKLKKVKDINSKKFVAVSHHLPFFEELSVGTYTKNSSETKNLPNLLNRIDKVWLNIPSGEDYGIPNYFFSVAKGDFSGYDSIPKIFHYVNNGVLSFTKDVPSVFKNWIHGHEHYYSFIDYVKGIKVCTSPMGGHGGVSFSDTDMIVRTLTPNDDEKNAMKLKISNSFSSVFEPIKITQLSLIENWCWYLLKNQKVMNEILLYERIYIKKMKSLKKLWKDYLSRNMICPLIVEDLQLLDAAQESCLKKVTNFLDNVKEAIVLRSDENYSYLNYMSERWKVSGSYNEVLPGLKIDSKRMVNVELLLNLNRDSTLKAMFPVKDVIRNTLLEDYDVFNHMKYLKYALQYYEEAFKNLEVYDFATFEKEFPSVNFNAALNKRMMKKKEEIFYNSSMHIPINRNNASSKKILDKFFN